MEQLEFKDGDDGDDDELDVEFLPEQSREIYWTDDVNEIRRFVIFAKMADPTVDGKILVENMEAIFQWCIKGEVPTKKKSHLKVAET